MTAALRRALAASLVVGLGLPGTAGAARAQSSDAHDQAMDTAAFLTAARAAADRYRDPAVARSEGYRLVGPDFPAMGEHWVQPGRLVSGRFDASAPPILSYVPVDGGRVLAGVAYAVPLRPGEDPPAFPSPGAWHDHTGSVDEESLLVAPHAHHGDGSGPRLAMLHAWTEMPNPAGVFGQHNWMLPFHRLGLTMDGVPPEAAARAVSLLGGGVDYYRSLVQAAASPDSSTLRGVEAALARAAAGMDAWRASLPPGPVAPDALDGAGERWFGLLTEVAETLSPAAWARVRPLMEPAGDAGHPAHQTSRHPAEGTVP